MAKVVEARRRRKKANKSATTQVNNNCSPYLVGGVNLYNDISDLFSTNLFLNKVKSTNEICFGGPHIACSQQDKDRLAIFLQQTLMI